MNERLKYFLLVVLMVTAAALCFLSARTVQHADDGSAGFMLTPADQSQPATDLTLTEAQTGEAVSLLAAARQHPIVLDFWATWCGPCRAELPHLVAVSRKYQGRVTFYGINSNDSPAKILAFSKDFPLPFPTLIDAHGAAAEAYGVNGIPRLVVIDTQDRIRLLASGYDPQADVEEDLGQDLKTLLAKP
jgi:thiol-disulfide isomerase/thioredoxin